MTTRRLAAILAADVAGFSAMMERDEEGTAARVRALRRDVIEPTLAQHHGRLVKTTGDGFLAEFASPVEAVRSALAIQGQTARNDDSASLMRLRIGINLGDIIVEPDGDIVGDGVNVAARLEQIAEQGTIFISGSVHEHVQGKTNCAFEDRGEQQVKNIARPVRVYAVAGQGTSTDPQSKRLPLPDKPSIAVLPFTNMSGDPEQEYFADGVVEDIITALSRVKSFFVIARNSSFTFKGRAIDIRQVGRELGVRYVLEGSVRKAGNRVRITGQLIEAENGRHLWADRFDGSLDHIFELQDEITGRVVAAIEPSVRAVEVTRAKSKPTEKLDAYDLYLRALPEFHSGTDDGFMRAESFLREALARDPDYGEAWSALSDCLSRLVVRGTDGRTPERVRDACDAALKAAASDPENGTVLATTAWTIAMLGGLHEQAAEFVDRALKLHPNSAQVRTACGWSLIFQGEPSHAMQHFQVARSLSPIDPRRFLTLTAFAAVRFFEKNFEEAVQWANRTLEERPLWVPALRYRAAALAHLGRLDEARKAASQVLAVQPNFTLRWMAVFTFRRQWMTELLFEGQRVAGLPE